MRILRMRTGISITVTRSDRLRLEALIRTCGAYVVDENVSSASCGASGVRRACRQVRSSCGASVVDVVAFRRSAHRHRVDGAAARRPRHHPV